MPDIAKLQFNFGKDFDRAIYASLGQAVKRRQDRIRRKVRTRLKKIINIYVRTSAVMKSLQGREGAYSLQAELGLRDRVAEAALKRILDVMINAVDVSVKAGRGDRTSGISEIFIRKVFDIDLIEERLNLDAFPFVYNSNTKGTKTKIRWGRIVMDPQGGIQDEFIPRLYEQAENGLYYGIVRRGGAGSRSGMAIMLPSFNFPYVFPRLLIPKTKAKNFLDEILRSRNFRSDVVKAVEEVINDELRNI